MAENGWLVIEHGPDEGGTFHLRQDVLTIGRAPTNLIQIVHHSVSRRHAQLRKTPDGYLVTDLKSSNGTFVNGEKISSPTILNHNDQLQVGEIVLKFKLKTILGNRKDLIMERKEASPRARVMETKIQPFDESVLETLKMKDNNPPRNK